MIVEEKNKEKDMLVDELAEKDKQIVDLNDYTEQLKKQIGNLEQKLNINEDKVNSSINEDDLSESDSICLSFAEAESLKNIIETKEKMFQHQIEALKRKSAVIQTQRESQIIEMASKLKEYESERQQLEVTKNS